MAWLSTYAISGIRAEHPEEIQTLRDIYGDAFFVISAYAPREKRVKELAGLIAQSDGDSQSRNYRHQAEELIPRDEDEQEVSYVQGNLKRSISPQSRSQEA